MPYAILCRSDTLKKLTTTWLQDRPSFKIVLPQLITGTSALSSNWLSQICRMHPISSHASAEIVTLTGKIGSSVMGSHRSESPAWIGKISGRSLLRPRCWAYYLCGRDREAARGRFAQSRNTASVCLRLMPLSSSSRAQRSDPGHPDL